MPTIILILIFNLSGFELCWSNEFSSEVDLNIVALFKDKVVILDEYANNKMISVGDATNSGFKLRSSDSKVAIFEDSNGKLLKVELKNTIQTGLITKKPEIKITLNEKDQYLTNVNINHKQPSLAIIDTGANFVTLSSDTANKLGIDFKDQPKIKVSTASDDTFGYQILLEEVTIGEISLANIEAIIIEGDDPELILIGMSYLKNLELSYIQNKLTMRLP